MSDCVNNSRRDFISKVALVGTVTLAPGVLLNIAQAKPDDVAVTSKTRWGMLIDTNKCASGCTSCVDACNEEFDLIGSMPESSDAQKTLYIRKVTLKEKSTGHELSLPLMCQHCENPPCVDVCPTGASFKRTDGIVLVDKHICIGCRYCMMACPYKARSFVHEDITDQKAVNPRGKGCVESCTLCVHKVDRGDGTTACAEACEREGHRAILFGDLKDPDSEISRELRKYPSTQVRADLNLNTGVRYRNI